MSGNGPKRDGSQESGKSVAAPKPANAYDDLLGGIAGLLEEARRPSARAVNALMTATYWEIGRRIVEFEQGGKRRVEYGKGLIERLAKDLTRRFTRGFSRQNLWQMRAFYLAWPAERRAKDHDTDGACERILQTPSGESPAPPVGLILCAEKNAALARYALDNLPNKVLAAEYRTVLPDEEVIAKYRA